MNVSVIETDEFVKDGKCSKDNENNIVNMFLKYIDDENNNLYQCECKSSCNCRLMNYLGIQGHKRKYCEMSKP